MSGLEFQLSHAGVVAAETDLILGDESVGELGGFTQLDLDPFFDGWAVVAGECDDGARNDLGGAGAVVVVDVDAHFAGGVLREGGAGPFAARIGSGNGPAVVTPRVGRVADHAVDRIHGFLQAVFREVHRAVAVERAVGKLQRGAAQTKVTGQRDGDHGREDHRGDQQRAALPGAFEAAHAVTRLFRMIKRAESTTLEAVASDWLFRMERRESWSCLVD